MQGSFTAFLLCSQMDPVKDTILFIDPGFPVQRSQTKILGIKSASFDISGFMGMLYGIFPASDYCYFNITVGDAGGETKKSLQFYVQL